MRAPCSRSTAADPPRGCGPRGPWSGPLRGPWERPGARPAKNNDVSLVGAHGIGRDRPVVAPADAARGAELARRGFAQRRHALARLQPPQLVGEAGQQRVGARLDALVLDFLDLPGAVEREVD